MAFEYPKMENGKPRYVRMPMQFTEDEVGYIKEHLEAHVEVNIPVGKWIAVNIQREGYSFLPAPVLFDDFESCEKACIVGNKFHGWSEDEANEIISMSMGLKPWPDDNE